MSKTPLQAYYEDLVLYLQDDDPYPDVDCGCDQGSCEIHYLDEEA